MKAGPCEEGAWYKFVRSQRVKIRTVEMSVWFKEDLFVSNGAYLWKYHWHRWHFLSSATPRHWNCHLVIGTSDQGHKPPSCQTRYFWTKTYFRFQKTCQRWCWEIRTEYLCLQNFDDLSGINHGLLICPWNLSSYLAKPFSTQWWWN